MPQCIEQSRRIQAIPVKKTVDALVSHLSRDEMIAIMKAPNIKRRSGIRDRAMINLCFSAGLRVSELIGLCNDDIDLSRSPAIHIVGKGRKERKLPLWKETVDILGDWLAIRPTVRASETFLNSRGEAITRSGFQYILSKHVKTATCHQSSLKKKNVTPHSLRHTCALITLQATHDIRKVALWLGHENIKSTEIYLRLDVDEKLETLSSIVPPSLTRGKFTVSEKLVSKLLGTPDYGD